MKAFVFLVLIGVACAAPSLFTPEVAAARAEVKEVVTGNETEVETEASKAEAELEAAVEDTVEVVAEAAPVEEDLEVAVEDIPLEAREPVEEVVEVAAEDTPLEAPEAIEEVVEVANEDAPLEAPEAIEEVVEVAAEPAPLVAPKPVTDTEEVALAKKEFAAAYEAALAAIAANTLPEVVHPEGAPAPVEDTAEVADAKAKFAIAFKAAADAAEAAGDIDEDGSLSRFSGFISPLLTNTFPFGAYGVHAPVVYSAGTVVHATTPLTLKGSPLHFSYPFAPSFAFVKA